jgi:phage terminase large subunit-like protein
MKAPRLITLQSRNVTGQEFATSWPPEKRTLIEAEFKGGGEDDHEAYRRDWVWHGRPEQQAPDIPWRYWLILAGRGFGKTRAGAEWVRQQVEQGRKRIALVAPTTADARDVMVEGESGLIAIAPRGEVPVFQPSRRRLVWPNGAKAFLYSAQEPERLRGPQHEAAWADEVCAWPNLQSTWDQLLLGLRLGDDPRLVATTTPKPLPLLKALIADRDCVVRKGSTYDNAANLSPAFIQRIVRRYEGARLGRQELHAEILDDAPGALWTYETLIKARIAKAPDLVRVVVAVDPSGSTGADEGDAQGIVVAGLGVDGAAYVLADRTCRLSPEGWGRRAVEAFDDFGADRIVAEKNFGGDMVRAIIQTVRKSAPVTLVSASRGKMIRAEPVSALYEQGRVRHLIPDPADNPLAELEHEMSRATTSGYLGDSSPNRLDALVWALTELMLGEAVKGSGYIDFARQQMAQDQ